MEREVVYTDGGCWPNPGKGGWGFTNLKNLGGFGGEQVTTNQRMEMMAVIRALEAYKRVGKKNVCVVSDSQYVINGCTAWRINWEKNGFISKAKEPVKNVDLWKQLFSLCDEIGVEFNWVKGHSGNEGNEQADYLAKKGSRCTPEEINSAENKRVKFLIRRK